MASDPIIDYVRHYQRSIDRGKNDEKKVLHCIAKLYKLPIKIEHLSETGIGKTVNNFRKVEGEVGIAAKALVAKWKTMVEDAREQSPEEEELDEKSQINTVNKTISMNQENSVKTERNYHHKSRNEHKSNESDNHHRDRSHSERRVERKERERLLKDKERQKREKHSEKSGEVAEESIQEKPKEHRKDRCDPNTKNIVDINQENPTSNNATKKEEKTHRSNKKDKRKEVRVFALE